MPCESGHTVTVRFYKNSISKKVREFYNKKRTSKGRPGVHHLHDNPSSHKCEIVKPFLASEKVKILNHPSYSSDLCPCDFFLFPRLKNAFLKISILEVLLAALFISAPTKRRLFICFSRLCKKVTKMCFSKGGII